MADDRLGPAAIRLAGVMARVASQNSPGRHPATPADVRAVLAGWVDGAEEPCFDGAALAAMMERFPDG